MVVGTDSGYGLKRRAIATPLRALSDLRLCWGIALVCCVPYLLLQSGGLEALSGWFMPQRLAQLLHPKHLWTLWSPTFVHYTLLHLLTNLYLWWLLASQLERYSRVRLLVLFAVLAAFSNFCQWSYDGPRFGGLSGVIYGLLAYMWVVNRQRPARYRIDPLVLIGLLILLPVAASGQFGKFANVAHVSGLLAGAALGWLATLPSGSDGKFSQR